jgi:tripartite-type tricarboxylate transporter receptor subunit TctC
MDLSRRDFVGALAAIGLPISSAFAQGFPARTITLICPWPAGGGADTQMRGLAKGAGAVLGQTVIVENRPGATGTLAAAFTARARPDGYTLAQSHNAVLRQPFITATQYDAAKDFTYIIGISDNPFGLVVKADSPWGSFEEFLNHARQNPDKVTIAVPGIGSPGHLVADQIVATQKVRWTPVPYKGTADSMQALLGGHVTAAAESTGWVPFVESGRLRLLAVFGNRRLKKYPNVPTLKEVGIDVADFSPWGIVGPAGMDPFVTKTLHDAFKKAMEDPEFVTLLGTLAQEPLYMSGDAYRKYAVDALPFQKSVVEKYGLRQN